MKRSLKVCLFTTWSTNQSRWIKLLRWVQSLINWDAGFCAQNPPHIIRKDLNPEFHFLERPYHSEQCLLNRRHLDAQGGNLGHSMASRLELWDANTATQPHNLSRWMGKERAVALSTMVISCSDDPRLYKRAIATRLQVHSQVRNKGNIAAHLT